MGAALRAKESADAAARFDYEWMKKFNLLPAGPVHALMDTWFDNGSHHTNVVEDCRGCVAKKMLCRYCHQALKTMCEYLEPKNVKTRLRFMYTGDDQISDDAL